MLNIRILATLVTTLLLLISASSSWGYRIGFSQVTTTEPWRVLFNKQLRAEAKKHPDIQLYIADGQDRTEKQVADVQSFIQQKVDIILLAPKESAGLTAVVKEAMAAGIPVIVLDRKINGDHFTQFIGGNNLEIGRQAGHKALALLGGQGNAHGNIVEIWGGMGSTPAHERHQGFVEVLQNEQGLNWLVDRQDGDWKQDKAYNIMSNALRANPKIDLVYAHNDPMAFGAFLAARDAQREKDMFFLGVDAIPKEGALWVKRGFLTATFVYPAPGIKALQEALRLLKGEKLEKYIDLPTQTIDESTVDAYLKANR
ncbi:substrate-binding domain-containing protein [uncultured Pseudoteredinibacter sp.]|uniref:substrate-binding domain-containing protein n=1 Tax=uncultured Pseudoteredinibacter sp. TaxID=1641701 RepID=UPI00261B4456|nr:substrate-binding domain-containing protein [uncultured Pseudoteredinibacter sp.]